VLTLLYRGTLSSCNYSCAYCPFAKRRDTRATLARDAAEVARFVAWAGTQTKPMRLLFTPWGEALVRRHYREAILGLAQMPHVHQVAVQTNLAAPLEWLARAPAGKIALWCTYHPGQTTLERFVERCTRLDAMRVPHSVGVVALQEHRADIDALRAALPPSTHLWLNAYDRRGPGYYGPEELRRFEQLDPWFRHGIEGTASRGRPCRTGEDVFSVDGDGEVRRCHFVPARLGNLYVDPIAAMSAVRPCPRMKCDCFIGYAHRKDLPLAAAFGDGLLARIPIAVVSAAMR
jgi:MoaA/NifB/PqqE/SkfB family radical SAM enzyme